VKSGARYAGSRDHAQCRHPEATFYVWKKRFGSGGRVILTPAPTARVEGIDGAS
jgi:hypothetical protein